MMRKGQMSPYERRLQDILTIPLKLRVEYYYDDEARRWGFTVPALHILGSGDTREEAEAHAVEAIAYALEGVEQDHDQGADVQVAYLDVELTPHRPANAVKAG
jgi:predicted RNase H-like HicB family nuclease